MSAALRSPARRPPPAAGGTALLHRTPAWVLTAVLAGGYVALAPQSPDLAAASYRSWLFAHDGFTLWDNSWYAGHHLLAYSLLAPAIGALIGPQLLAALSMTAASALFAALVAGRFPGRASRIAAIWFALGASVQLLSSRVPFDLGLAVGLASLLLAQRGRLALALALAALTSLASPVAGAFLALAFLAWALAGPQRRWPGALTLAALAPLALLEVAFPEGGSQPFDPSAFYPALAGVLAIAALLPRERRAMRIGALLYAAALIGSFVLTTAVGGNADRLGALAAGPFAAAALAGGALSQRHTRALLLLAPALVYWQANAPVADLVAAEGSQAVRASYYAPLLGELSALGAARATRVEVVPTAVHWEARYLAPAVMLARGWERQLDRLRSPLFYTGARTLASPQYASWLEQQGIAYVALPDAPLDYSGVAEARLLRAGPPRYLREAWRSPHWRLFAVLGAQPLVSPAGRLSQVASDTFTLQAPRAGRYRVLLHYTRYWALSRGHGCVARAPGDWTEVRAEAPGSYRVAIAFSLARAIGGGPRCR